MEEERRAKGEETRRSGEKGASEAPGLHEREQQRETGSVIVLQPYI